MENSRSVTIPVSVEENETPINPKIAELTESRQELLNRLQNLRQDLQNWRMNMDTQVKDYQTELSELKKSLNTEMEQLRSEFQDLRTTLKQQQEDVTASLKSLGLQDVLEENKDERSKNVEQGNEADKSLLKEENGVETSE